MFDNKIILIFIDLAKSHTSTCSMHAMLYRRARCLNCGLSLHLRPNLIRPLDFKLKKVLLRPLGNFADIPYLKEKFKLRRIRDVCTLYVGAFVRNRLLHMLLYQIRKKENFRFKLYKKGMQIYIFLKSFI